ncbi:PQQ-binding-like beta-propeller repeat protein [Brevibacillus sp. SYSU BS000544]|uniref:outer membrane protein assembly factor BamB family protein n=1 Tax=Brevibacillus sp. SYSU BS000544 TaxID=3416443 RepID=UPI003CE58FE2
MNTAFADRFQFEQGEGYEQGAYDQLSAQPTTFNWTRQTSLSGPSKPEEKWTNSISSDPSSPVLSADGSIYVLEQATANLLAFDSEGNKKWAVLSNANQAPWWYSPVVGKNGTIYYGEESGVFHAVSSEGKKLWDFDANMNIYNSSAIGANGTIFFTGLTALFALNPDGTLLWKYSPGSAEFKWSTPVIAKDGTIIIGANEVLQNELVGGVLFAVNPDGTLKWMKKFEDKKANRYFKISTVPVLDENGDIYVSLDYGDAENPELKDKIFALDLDGNTKWKYTLNDGEGALHSSPIVDKNGTIYVPGNKRLYAFNKDGKKKWMIKIPIHSLSTPIIDNDGILYFGGVDQAIYAVNAKTGQVKWRHQTDMYITSAPVIDRDQSLLFTSEKYDDGKLVKLGNKEKEVIGLQAESDSVQLKLNEKRQLKIVAIYDDETTEDVTAKASWSSSYTKVVTVEKGLLTAIDTGKVFIKAKYGGQTIAITVNVR